MARGIIVIAANQRPTEKVIPKIDRSRKWYHYRRLNRQLRLKWDTKAFEFLHIQQIIDNIEISDKYEPPQPPPRYGLAMALIAIVAVCVVLYSAKPAAPKSNPATGS